LLQKTRFSHEKGETFPGPLLEPSAEARGIPLYLREGTLLPVGLTDSLQWGQSVSQTEVVGLVVTLPQEAIKTQCWINEEKMASEVYGCLKKSDGKRVLLKRRIRHHEGVVRTINSSSRFETTLEDVTFG
jgi:hypothetical protein